MHRARPAYTLLELFLVMALILMLGALAIPSVDAMYGNVRLRAASDQVRSVLLQARGHAMDEGRAYRFAVVPGRGNYRVAPDSVDYWAGGEAPPGLDPNNPPLVLEDTLPRGIPFVLGDSQVTAGRDTNAPSGGVDPSSWVPVVTFLPDGTASDDKQITLQLSGNRPVVLRLRALTGGVTVQ